MPYNTPSPNKWVERVVPTCNGCASCNPCPQTEDCGEAGCKGTYHEGQIVHLPTCARIRVAGESWKGKEIPAGHALVRAPADYFTPTGEIDVAFIRKAYKGSWVDKDGFVPATCKELGHL